MVDTETACLAQVPRLFSYPQSSICREASVYRSVIDGSVGATFIPQGDYFAASS